jgi:hypothetical protein
LLQRIALTGPQSESPPKVTRHFYNHFSTMADAAAVTTDEAGGEGISKNALKKQVREQIANSCNAKICGSQCRCCTCCISNAI